MDVYLIRHGQTTTNAEKAHAGWAPAELTEEGRIQAERTRQLLKENDFDRVYVSDLVRTRQTADIIFPGKEHILDRRIRERHVGILEFQKISDCIEKYGAQYLDARARRDFSAFQGETDKQLAGRVGDFMRFLEQIAMEENPPKKTAVVCHGGSIYHMFRYVFDTKMTEERLTVKNCSISKFIWENGRWKMVFWNLDGTIE